jgi:glucokinase
VSRCVLCVDIGGTSSKVAVLNSLGELQFVNSLPTVPPVDQYIDGLLALIQKTVAQAEKHALIPTGIGVAVAGFLTPQRDRLFYNSNLAWLEGYPLRDRIIDRFPAPVELESDSNSACMAEQRFGCGRESKRFLCLTVGTGLGVGMAVDGEPLRIAHGCLGDIGHIIVQPHGLLCSCGGQGCAEALLSAPYLARLWAEKTGANGIEISLRNVIEAARGRDPDAIAILQDAGDHLGVATASMANILFPDVIAVAGGLSAAGDFVLQPAESSFRKSASILSQENVIFSQATLGSQATLVGAAWPFWEGA